MNMFVNKLRYKPHFLGNFKTEKLLTDQSAIPSYLRKSSSFAGDVKVSRLHVYQLNTKKTPTDTRGRAKAYSNVCLSPTDLLYKTGPCTRCAYPPVGQPVAYFPLPRTISPACGLSGSFEFLSEH